MTETSAEAVTKIVDRVPRPGMEAQLEEAIRDLTQAAARYPGHLGMTVLRPAPPSQPGFRLLYKFDSSEHLRAWEESGEQHELVRNANRYTQGEPRYHALSGLEAWFTLPASAEHSPSKSRMTLLSWAGIFVLVYVYGTLINAMAPAGMPYVLRVLVLTGLVVPTMSYVVGPRLTRAFRRWLFQT
jgi:antibiotic biosynthesis monooxygenase (ABM) superfamily enzyme